MDQPTSLVIAGCLCVVAASLVLLVILRMYQTFAACGRVPAVIVTSHNSAQLSKRFADGSSTTRLTNSGTEQRHDGDDVDDQKSAMLPLWVDWRQMSGSGVENNWLIDSFNWSHSWNISSWNSMRLMAVTSFLPAQRSKARPLLSQCLSVYPSVCPFTTIVSHV